MSGVYISGIVKGGRPSPLSSVVFFAAGSRGAAPGGVSGVSPEILSPLAPEGSALKKSILERPFTWGLGLCPNVLISCAAAGGARARRPE